MAWDKTGNVRPAVTEDAATIAAWLAEWQAPTRPVLWDAPSRGGSNTTLGTSDSGHAWTALANTWGRVNGQLYMVNAGAATGIATVVLDEPVDYVQGDLDYVNDCALALRAPDANNNLLIQLSPTGGGRLTIAAVVGGVYSVLSYSNFVMANTGIYSVEGSYERGSGLITAKAGFQNSSVAPALIVTATLSTANRNLFENDTHVGLRSSSSDISSRYQNVMAGYR